MSASSNISSSIRFSRSFFVLVQSLFKALACIGFTLTSASGRANSPGQSNFQHRILSSYTGLGSLALWTVLLPVMLWTDPITSGLFCEWLLVTCKFCAGRNDPHKRWTPPLKEGLLTSQLSTLFVGTSEPKLCWCSGAPECCSYLSSAYLLAPQLADSVESTKLNKISQLADSNDSL